MAFTTVACKLPNGLLLRVFDWAEHDEPVMGGGFRTVKRASPIGEPVKIHGPATRFGEAPKTAISGGYALTPNVDADFFARWLEQNADHHDAVKNHLIFASDKRQVAHDEAREKKDILSGLEPLIPGKDRRIPRANSANLSAIETAKKD